MTRTFEGRIFHGLRGTDLSAPLEGLVFKKCTFTSCILNSTTRSPGARAIIRDISLVGCNETGCQVQGAIVEDCLIDGLKTSDLFIPNGTAFRHVVLRGRIDRVMLGASLAGIPDDATDRAFQEANKAFYKSIDWALDISHMDVQELDIQAGIPAHLIRRDPTRHILFRRDKLMDQRWRQFDLKGLGGLRVFLDDTLRYESGDGVFVIPDRDQRRKQILAAVQRLRDEGIAELD